MCAEVDGNCSVVSEWCKKQRAGPFMGKVRVYCDLCCVKLTQRHDMLHLVPIDQDCSGFNKAFRCHISARLEYKREGGDTGGRKAIEMSSGAMSVKAM